MITFRNCVAMSIALLFGILAFGCANRPDVGSRLDSKDYSTNSELSLVLLASGTRYQVGSQYRLDAIISNRTARPLTLWLRRKNYDIERLESQPDGTKVWRPFLLQTFSTHDNSAWSRDIVVLSSGASRTQTWQPGLNAPAILHLRARYENAEQAVRAENWNLRPELFEYRTNLWTGVVHSQPISIEFYANRDGVR